MLIERNEGILERSLVTGMKPSRVLLLFFFDCPANYLNLIAGITGTEILFSHVVTQFSVMSGQTVMVLLFAFITVVDIRGGLGWVVLLTVLTGLCGMCFGKSNS